MLACYAVAIANPVARHRAIESSSVSGIQPTRAVPSRTIAEGANPTTGLWTEDVTSSINNTQVEGTKSEASSGTVQDRTASELDPSLQILFLVLGTLLGLANVVVTAFFGYKQLLITTNQLNAERNHGGNDVELAELDVANANDEVVGFTTRHNSHTLNVAFIRALESATVHIANELRAHLVTFWSFVRHLGDLVLPSVMAARPGGPLNSRHEQHMRPDEPHG